MRRFEVVVIGSGPAGEGAAMTAAKRKQTAIVPLFDACPMLARHVCASAPRVVQELGHFIRELTHCMIHLGAS